MWTVVLVSSDLSRRVSKSASTCCLKDCFQDPSHIASRQLHRRYHINSELQRQKTSSAGIYPIERLPRSPVYLPCINNPMSSQSTISLQATKPTPAAATPIQAYRLPPALEKQDPHIYSRSLLYLSSAEQPTENASNNFLRIYKSDLSGASLPSLLTNVR